jgi:hypothetical protein
VRDDFEAPEKKAPVLSQAWGNNALELSKQMEEKQGVGGAYKIESRSIAERW